MGRLLLAAYFLEVGLLLVVVPWSYLWDRNFLLALVPAIHQLAQRDFVRGAISGLGVVNLAFGVAEIVRFWSERWGSRARSAALVGRPGPPDGRPA